MSNLSGSLSGLSYSVVTEGFLLDPRLVVLRLLGDIVLLCLVDMPQCSMEMAFPRLMPCLPQVIVFHLLMIALTHAMDRPAQGVLHLLGVAGSQSVRGEDHRQKCQAR